MSDSRILGAGELSSGEESNAPQATPQLGSAGAEPIRAGSSPPPPPNRSSLPPPNRSSLPSPNRSSPPPPPNRSAQALLPNDVSTPPTVYESSVRSPGTRASQPPLKANRVIKLGHSTPPSAPAHDLPSESSSTPPLTEAITSRPPAPADEMADSILPAPQAVPDFVLSSAPPLVASTHPVASAVPSAKSLPPVASSLPPSPTSGPALSIRYEETVLDESGLDLDEFELSELTLETQDRTIPQPRASELRDIEDQLGPPPAPSSLPPGRTSLAGGEPQLPEIPAAGLLPTTGLLPGEPLTSLPSSSAPLIATESGAEAASEQATALPQRRRMPIPTTPLETDIFIEEELDEEQLENHELAESDNFEVPPAERKPPPPRRSTKPILPQAQKPRSKPWWETLFGDDFQRAYRPMTDAQLNQEVDFVVQSFALPRGSVLLDLGCGQGEMCVEMTRRGYSVVGYDLSVYQLAMAGDNAQNAGQKINFLQGDMREMAFDNMFDGMLCWDTSFGFFEEEKNTEVLQRMKRALKPGGRLVLDILNRDFVGQHAPHSHWFEGEGCVCMDDMSVDWITNRLKVKRSIILDDGRSKELQYSIRLYSLSEIGRMLHDVGFRVSAISGGVATRGAFFGPVSPRIIIEAIKP